MKSEHKFVNMLFKRANNTLYKIQHQNYDQILDNIVSNSIYCLEIHILGLILHFCVFFFNFPCYFSAFVLFFNFCVFSIFFLYFQDSVHSGSFFCVFNLFYLTIVLKQYQNEIMQEFHQLSHHQNRGDREMTISNTPNK